MLADSYDRLAAEYAARIAGELAHKPFDRALLDQLVELTRGLGPVCDLGCGPGHVAGYLHERGAPVFGLDLSAGMVDVARRLQPAIEFQQGDLRRLALPDGSLGGVVALYVLIHVPAEQMVDALREL